MRAGVVPLGRFPLSSFRQRPLHEARHHVADRPRFVCTPLDECLVGGVAQRDCDPFGATEPPPACIGGVAGRGVGHAASTNRFSSLLLRYWLVRNPRLVALRDGPGWSAGVRLGVVVSVPCLARPHLGVSSTSVRGFG
jgi:hypothetical protein